MRVEAGKSYMVSFSLYADAHRLSKTMIVPDIPVIDAYAPLLPDRPNLDLNGAPARVADDIAHDSWSLPSVWTGGGETFGTNYDLYSPGHDVPLLTSETLTGQEFAARLEEWGGSIPSTVQFTIKES